MNQMNQMNQMNKMITEQQMQLMNQMNINLNQNNLLGMNQNNNSSQKFTNYDKEMKDKSSKILQINFLKGNEKLYFSLKGLSNVGLTCYMNSTLQCLLHVVELSYYIVNSYNDFKRSHFDMMAKTESRGLLSDEFKNILDNVLTENKEKRFFWDDVQNSFAPYEFNKLIGKLNPQFKKYEANDAKDLIIYLLQEMHEELNYFGGKKLDKIPKCNH